MGEVTTENKKTEEKNLRVEKHLIKQSNKVFKVIDSYSFLSKNLYNAANYILRQVFIFGHKLKHGEITEEKLPENIKELFKGLNSAIPLYDKNRTKRYEEKVKVGKIKDKIKKTKGKPDKTITVEEQRPKETKLFGIDNYIIGYEFLDYYMKDNIDYKSLKLVQSSQQVLKVLLKDWQSFFKGIKAYKATPSLFKAQPSIPNYKNPKTGRNNVYLTNQNCSIKNGFLVFPTHLTSLNNTVKTDINPDSLQMVRINQHLSCYEIEIVYKASTGTNSKVSKSMEIQKKQYKEFYDLTEKTKVPVDLKVKIGAGDLGIDNFITITNNTGIIPFIINGKEIKIINQFYNKRISELRALPDSVRARKKNQYHILKELKSYGYTIKDFSDLLDKIKNGVIIVDSILKNYILNSVVIEDEVSQAEEKAKEYKKLTMKRNNRINDFIHKTARFLTNFLKENNFNTFVIGWNEEIKQNISMGTTNNQSFCSIPFRKFIGILDYKLKDMGINLIVREESYTSKSSFLDNDFLPTYGDSVKVIKFSGTRYKKSFESAKNGFIQADVNGSYNILRKEFEDFNILNHKYIKDKWLFRNPIKINMQIKSFYPIEKYLKVC